MQAIPFLRRARGLPLALLLALGASAASAASFSFEGLTDSGPLPGLAFSGSFGYEEPAALFDGSVALQAFALDFAGQAYSLATADAGTLPAAVFVAGAFTGIDYLDTGSADLAQRPQLQFTAGFFDPGQAFFGYWGRDASGATLQGFGSYRVSALTSARPPWGSCAVAAADRPRTRLGRPGLAAHPQVHGKREACEGQRLAAAHDRGRHEDPRLQPRR